MSEFFASGLAGLAAGAMFGLIALGTVVVYRGSGVVNFANGAVAAIGAYVWAEGMNSGLSTVPAVMCGVAAAAMTGVIIQMLVMRWLGNASALSRLVATLGIYTVIQVSLGLIYNDNVSFPQGFLPTGVIHVTKTVAVGQDRLWIFGIAVLLSVLLWAVYRWSRFGITTEAVAEKQEAAAALGRSPDTVAVLNWAIGSAVAGFAGILIVPIIGLSVNLPLLLLVPGLAAALVGHFRSFPLAMVGGILIGVIETELQSGATWIPSFLTGTGWAQAVPFFVIIIVLMLSGKAIPVRGSVFARLPAVGTGRIRPAWVIVGLVVVFIALDGLPFLGLGGVNANAASAISATAAEAVICLSVIVVVGYAGQLSLAQYALAGIGAYVAARAAAGGQLVGLFGLGHLSFGVAILVGIACTIPIGVVVGLPALRTRGVSLAIVTMGLALIIEQVVLANDAYTGGFKGTVVQPPTLFGVDLNPVTHPDAYAGFCTIVAAIVALVVANARRGATGRRLIAVRDNERAAAAMGISVLGNKLYAFGLASAIAAVGGILLAFSSSPVLFSPYTAQNSIFVIMESVIGGIGYIGGALFGGLLAGGGLFSYLGSLIHVDALYIALASGVVVVINVVMNPDGVAGNISRTMRWIETRADRLAAPARERTRWLAGHRWSHSAVEKASSDPGLSVSPKSLVVSGVSVRFGGVAALTDVSLEVNPGEIVGLIGPNGAGKTTFIDVVTGFTRPQQGKVKLGNTVISGWSPSRCARQGLARSFQSLELFSDLSISDNLRNASDPATALRYVSDLMLPRTKSLAPAAAAAVEDFGLSEYLDAFPDELPHGVRRLVAVARAVSGAPSVLLLDEPAAGLDEHETEEFGRLIRHVADTWGVGILLVEHDISLVMSSCDRIVVLDFGEVIAEGTPDEIRQHDAVVEAYLGDEDQSLWSQEPVAAGMSSNDGGGSVLWPEGSGLD